MEFGASSSICLAMARLRVLWESKVPGGKKRVKQGVSLRLRRQDVADVEVEAGVGGRQPRQYRKRVRRRKGGGGQGQGQGQGQGHGEKGWGMIKKINMIGRMPPCLSWKAISVECGVADARARRLHVEHDLRTRFSDIVAGR